MDDYKQGLEDGRSQILAALIEQRNTASAVADLAAAEDTQQKYGHRAYQLQLVTDFVASMSMVDLRPTRNN